MNYINTQLFEPESAAAEILLVA